MSPIWLLTTAAHSEPAPRPFAPPPAREAPGPATPRSEACVDGQRVTAYERERETAALDAALRADGGLILAVTVAEGECLGACKPGATMRGPSGEHWLVVGVGAACDLSNMVVAMDAGHAVFQVSPWAEPVRVRRVRACSPTWAGCGGVELPPKPIVVEVPLDAHPAGPRSVRFPMDVGVVVDPPTDRSGNPVQAAGPP